MRSVILAGFVIAILAALATTTSANDPTSSMPATDNLPVSDPPIIFKLPDPDGDSVPATRRVIIVIVVVTVMTISLLGNGFLIRRFIQQKRYRTPTNRLIISQCFADLVLTAIAMPLAVASQFTESGGLLSYPFDLIQIFAMRLFMTVSVMNLSAVAVDRLCALRKHDSSSTMSPQKASALAAIFWILSIFVSLPLEICAEGVEHYRQTVNTDFGLLRRHETKGTMMLTAPALRTIVLCFSSVVVAVYCFVNILILIRSRKSEVSSTPFCGSGKVRTVRLRVRSAYTVILVFAVFFLSTLPFYTLFILTTANVAVSPCLLIAAKMLSWSSTATKPFVYIFRCKKWRGKRLFALLHGKTSLEEIMYKKKQDGKTKFFPQPVIDFTGQCVLPNSSQVS